MKIKIIGHLFLKVGFKTKEIDLDAPTKLRTLISLNDVSEDRLVVLINEVGGSFDSIVSNEDVVKILPVVGGG